MKNPGVPATSPLQLFGAALLAALVFSSPRITSAWLNNRRIYTPRQASSPGFATFEYLGTERGRAGRSRLPGSMKGAQA
jgi:hypothetical protein